MSLFKAFYSTKLSNDVMLCLQCLWKSMKGLCQHWLHSPNILMQYTTYFTIFNYNNLIHTNLFVTIVQYCNYLNIIVTYSLFTMQGHSIYYLSISTVLFATYVFDCKESCIAPCLVNETNVVTKPCQEAKAIQYVHTHL